MAQLLQLLKDNPILIVVAILVVTYVLNKQVEYFTAVKAIITPEEYYSDIRNLNSYVGPYIGEIYSYLRAKYFDPEKNVSLGPLFQPSGLSDPTLADPLLPIARLQIKSWIDSAKLLMKKKYDPEFLAEHAPKQDIFYEETPEKVLRVIHVKNGEAMTYLV